jgi:hypothetical protein
MAAAAPARWSLLEFCGLQACRSASGAREDVGFIAQEGFLAKDAYTVGKIYYQIGLADVGRNGAVVPVVSSWRYDGIRKLECNSAACDVPYHFLQFTGLTGAADAADKRAPRQLCIPSAAHAKISMLDWETFRLRVAELVEDTEAGALPQDDG